MNLLSMFWCLVSGAFRKKDKRIISRVCYYCAVEKGLSEPEPKTPEEFLECFHAHKPTAVILSCSCKTNVCLSVQPDNNNPFDLLPESHWIEN